MSNLDESSISEILSKFKSKDKVVNEGMLRKSSRIKMNKKKKKIKEELGEQSKISYNYTESSNTINRPSTTTTCGAGQMHHPKLMSIHQNSKGLEKRNDEMQ
jgi:hypothetical protein